MSNDEKMQLILNYKEGMYKPLIEALPFKLICFDCTHFDPNGPETYRCNTIPECTAVTLSAEVNADLLQALQT